MGRLLAALARLAGLAEDAADQDRADARRRAALLAAADRAEAAAIRAAEAAERYRAAAYSIPGDDDA